MIMGRTVPSFRITLGMEKAEWKPFRNALDKSERKQYDEMWDIPRLYISACSNSVQLVPLQPKLSFPSPFGFVVPKIQTVPFLRLERGTSSRNSSNALTNSGCTVAPRLSLLVALSFFITCCIPLTNRRNTSP
jgi:hypothetical protein